MLDNCSQQCFVKSSFVKNLRIKGHKTSVSVKTLTQEKTHTSFAVDRLKVSRTSSLDAEWINVPKAYTKDDLPVDSSEIATPEKIKKSKYLQEIAEKISHSDNMKVELLIGDNCIRAPEPVQVIASRDRGPYAMKTVLEWCIVGPTACINSRNESLTCNRMAVQETGSNKIVNHYFVVEEQIKSNEGIPAMLKRIYEVEFTEQQVKFNNIIGETLGEISHDDQQFLKLMVLKVNGHYAVPLLLKSKDVNLPSNSVLAIKRLNCLERRFLKDECFYKMYKTFVSDMIARGYARKADNNGKSRKTWYIPHHGVYRRGTSINNQLISGPDLANQLVGVLTGFRKEQVAFIADVDAMFHQVRVPKHQRSLLKFLWWEDRDIRNPTVEDNEMCVHLFGGISSPSCSNYALK